MSKLYVDEIQPKTTGGVITFQPNRPAFMARRTSNQSSGIVIFDTAMINKGSHYNTSDGKFTAPIDGLYSFSSVILSNKDGTDGYFTLAIYVNGASYAQMQGYSYVDNDFSSSITVIADLSANDYVQAHFTEPLYATSASTSNFTHFSGYLIG